MPLAGWVEGSGVAGVIEPPLRERIQPVDRRSGFRMEGYHVWGGSCLAVGGVYHLFASRWPTETGFPEGYRTHSEIVHATAERAVGPYTFREVVIGRREAGLWDSGMAHNPAVYRAADGFALFYIGSDVGSRYRQIGVATTSTMDGPWQRSERPLELGVESDANNPAAWIEPDGGVKLVWRDAGLRVRLSTAPALHGPYTVANDDLWPAARIEDFCLFRHGGRYHLVCEDNAGRVTGHERWGAHLASDDGVSDWQAWEPAAVYDHELQWTDGTSLHATRRERPWLLVDEGAVTHLFTAVWDGRAGLESGRAPGARATPGGASGGRGEGAAARSRVLTTQGYSDTMMVLFRCGENRDALHQTHGA